MSVADPTGHDEVVRVQISVLQEIFDLGLEAAGDVWPTPAMALSRLFERGARFLSTGAELSRIAGSASPELLDAINITREDLFLVEALYLLTRNVSYVLTMESNALEAVWLRLADRHLEIRTEIVERRREEEQLKRQLRSLGGVVVALPEHEDLPMSDSDRPRKSRGMYERLFEGASIVEVDLDVSSWSLAAAERVAEERGWDREWGEDARLLVLTHGISLALREREADAFTGDEDDAVQEAQNRSRARLAGMEGRYSSLRRRLFELRHNNRILKWRITALEVEAVGMRRRLDQFLVDRDRLEQEIADRIAAGAVPRAADRPSDGNDWRRRLSRLFGRRE